MALARSLSRLGASSMLVMRQRLELAALDIEEELVRLCSFLIVGVAGVLLASLSLAGACAAVVFHFWDTARIAAVLGVSGFLAAVAIGLAWWLLNALRAKPAFLLSTLREFEKDGEQLGQKA